MIGGGEAPGDKHMLMQFGGDVGRDSREQRIRIKSVHRCLTSLRKWLTN